MQGWHKAGSCELQKTKKEQNGGFKKISILPTASCNPNFENGTKKLHTFLSNRCQNRY